MSTTTIIDGEEEVVGGKTGLIINCVCIVIALIGVAFGFIQMGAKKSQDTRISNLEQSVNTHVAEVEALKAQLEENGIKPNINTTTKTETATKDDSEDKKDTSSSSSSKKETAGDGYSGYFLEVSGWNVKFEFPSGVKNLNYIPSDTSISITSLTTDTKTYDSDTCATGFGQVIIGGSAGTKIYSDSKGTYYYVAPSSNNSCSGTDYENAVALTKKLFEGITAK